MLDYEVFSGDWEFFNWSFPIFRAQCKDYMLHMDESGNYGRFYFKDGETI